MLDCRVHQDIALEEKYPCVAGSAPLTYLLNLHLRLDVIRECSESASGIAKAGSFDLHFAAIAAIGGTFQVGEAIFFQDGGVSCISRRRIFGSLHAFGIDAPAAKALRQRASGGLWLAVHSGRQQKNNWERTQTLRFKDRNHYRY